MLGKDPDRFVLNRHDFSFFGNHEIYFKRNLQKHTLNKFNPLGNGVNLKSVIDAMKKLSQQKRPEILAFKNIVRGKTNVSFRFDYQCLLY